MKILTPIMIAVLTFPVGAQEEVKPIPPVRKAPPVRSVGRPATPQNSTSAQKAAPSQATPVPSQTSRRRVVLPPNRAHPVPATRSSTTQGGRTSTGAKVPSSLTRTVQRPKVMAASAVPKVLTENISIHLQGTASEGTNLDLTLTGIGPIFQADVVTGDSHTILSHTYSVKPNRGGYTVEYNIGLRIRMEVARSKQTSSYEFREVSLTGTVLLSEGSKVAISKNGDQELSLSVSRAKQK